MPGKDYIPSTDEGKRVWSRNLATLVGLTPAAYGVLPATSTAYTATVDEYDAALTAAVDPSTRGRATILTKDTKRAILVAASRAIVATIQGHAGLSPTQKQNLGISLRDSEPTPIQAPTEIPVMKILSVNGWITEIQVTTAESTRRGLPDGVAGVNIYTSTDAVPPTDPNDWTFEGESSKARFKIQAPESLAVGSKFHIVCCFKSPRFQTGPACGPTTVVIGGGVPETNVG